MGLSDPGSRDTGGQPVMAREPPSPRGHVMDTDTERTGEREAAFSPGTTQGVTDTPSDPHWFLWSAHMGRC